MGNRGRGLVVEIEGQACRVDKPMARTAICFNLGHCSKVSSVIGIRVVITTSASFILSTIVLASEGVEEYSVYVCLKEGEKVGEGKCMPSRRTMLIICEEFIDCEDVKMRTGGR
jgi:hypothetical protein